ncbi:hypothetical protein QBC39DRAFT_308084 [Podospora conica]|nr:hypothetical protein QBC39DRAFT_308084 [Schizothecium conicum]
MSSTAFDNSQGTVIPSSLPEPHKKPKHKKKRARDEDDTAVIEETPRKPKKSRRDATDVAMGAADVKVKKEKKKREHVVEEEEPVAPPTEEVVKKRKSKKDKTQDSDAVEKKSKKHRKEPEPEPQPADEMEVDEPEALPVKEKKKKSKKHKVEEEPAPVEEVVQHKKKKKDKKRPASPEPEADAMEVDLPTRPKTKAEDPADTEYPFFTQTMSLYVPFFPVGWDKPLTNVAAQHLDPLVGHYNPTFRGVLLSYSHLNLADRPVKASLIHPPTDDTPAYLYNVDEYAVGFGWLTFEAELFVPARGKWLEGVVQLQSEGHIGVVCWNKFNASIEAKRLPKGWKWVDIAKKSPLHTEEEDEDELDGEDLQVVEQMHTTGYWVNEQGKKVGGKLKFRIKNFDVGLAGDIGYLSIEGTFLDDAAEQALAKQERAAEKRRRSKQNPNGLLRPMSRRVPEFSMTKLGREEEEEDEGQRREVYKGSRPGTPDD